MKAQLSENAGSTNRFEPAYVLIGKLGRPHGIKGEIMMQIISDIPQHLRQGRKVFLGKDKQEFTITNVRPKNTALLISFENMNNPEDVRKLTNQNVFVAVKDLPPLPVGTYYHHQLIGLSVMEADQLIGVIEDILITGANDVYVVRETNGKELLIPAIDSVILDIHLQEHRMDVVIPEGLRV